MASILALTGPVRTVRAAEPAGSCESCGSGRDPPSDRTGSGRLALMSTTTSPDLATALQRAERGERLSVDDAEALLRATGSDAERVLEAVDRTMHY